MSATSIFCNAGVGEQGLMVLRKGAAVWGYEVVLPSSGKPGSNLVEGPSDEKLLTADAAFGQPVVADVMRAEKLKLIQLSSAGWARYDRDDLKGVLRGRGAALCTASGVYAEPCAQHVLAFMLAEARQLASAWAGAGRRWELRPLRNASRLLGGQRALFLGYGSIAERLAELLAPLGMKVKALRRTVRGDERVPTYPIIAADELIPEADHVINILPGTSQTEGFFDARRLSLMKREAVFYNIGRGTTVNQEALAAMLRAGSLRAAYLDVTDPEPLPGHDPLWDAPNCYITPHTAGGYEGELMGLVEHFLANLGRWKRGEAVVDRVV